MEEELKREKSEMNKLLKAKQDIIEVQKRRIEGMANRLAHSQHQCQQQTRYNTTNVKSKQNELSNGNHNYQQNKLHQQQQQQQQAMKLNHNHSNMNGNNLKSFTTPVNATVISPTNLNNEVRSNHPHINLNAAHFLRTSEL